MQKPGQISMQFNKTRSPKEREKVYFASLYGSFNSSGALESGGVLKFKIAGEQLDIIDYQPTRGAVHHLDLTSDGEYILQGTTEGGMGKLYVLKAGADADAPMSVAAVIDAGKGAGHVFFSDVRKFGIVTNHDDDFLTVVDMDPDDDGAIDEPVTWTTTKAWIPRGTTCDEFGNVDDPGNIGRDATRMTGQKIQAHTASVSGIDPQEQYY